MKSVDVKKTIQVFNSLQKAEEADKEYYRSLSPAERIERLLILRDQFRPYPDEVTEGFTRVYRVIKHS